MCIWHLKVTVFLSVYLRPVTQNTWEKNHHFRDKKGHVQGHVTLTYKVTFESYSVVCLFEILDPKYLQNKKKAFLHPDIYENVTFPIFWRSWGVKMTSFGVIWRHHSSLCTRFGVTYSLYLGKVTEWCYKIFLYIFHMTSMKNVCLEWKNTPNPM